MMSGTEKDVIIKADSLAEAYAMAFEEVGPEFDVLEIKKVSSGAFGATSIQIRVASVQKKTKTSEEVEEVQLKKVDVDKHEALLVKKDEKISKEKLKLVKNNENNKKQPALKIKQDGALTNQKLTLKSPSAPSPVAIQGKNCWVDIVKGLRDEGFKEELIVKLLSEVRTTGKHLKTSPFGLIEDRLVYHCVNESREEKAINILFSKATVSAGSGISAYLFSKYAKQGLSSNKVVLTNSVLDLKKVLGADFLKILKVELVEVREAQDWLGSSSVILSQEEVCCVFFQKSNYELELPDVPDAMGAVSYTKLVNWSEDIHEVEVEFLKDCRAQLFVTGLEGNTLGSLLKPSLNFEIPTGFILRGKDFLSGLIHSRDLVAEVIESVSGVQNSRKVG